MINVNVPRMSFPRHFYEALTQFVWQQFVFAVIFGTLTFWGFLHIFAKWRETPQLLQFFFLLQVYLVEGYRPIAVRNRCKQQGIVFGWKHLCCDCNSAFVVRYLWCEYHSGSCSLYLLIEFCHHSDFSWVFFWFWALISMWIAISTALVGITVSLRSSFCVS